MDKTYQQDILSASKFIIFGKIITSLVLIVGLISLGLSREIYSLCLGIAIAIIPNALGIWFASIKARINPNVDIKVLARTVEMTQWVYTALFVLVAVKFLSFNSDVLLLSYSFTFLGCFIAPMLNKPQIRMT